MQIGVGCGGSKQIKKVQRTGRLLVSLRTATVIKGGNVPKAEVGAKARLHISNIIIRTSKVLFFAFQNIGGLAFFIEHNELYRIKLHSFLWQTRY